MKSLNTKLALSALGIALMATPAFAQPHRQLSPRVLYNYQVPAGDPSSGYPNPVARGGSAEQYQSGAMFNLGR
jgi:hypothetical protein